MIKTEIKLNYKNGKPMVTQKVVVMCEDCGKEKEIALLYQIKSLEKYGKDLCKGCMQKIQIGLGTRKKQYINAGLASIKNMKGKTYEEMYGKEKALELLKKNSENMSGEKNPNFGGKWYGIPPSVLHKGKKYEEIYGKEKSDLMKKNLSNKFSGENNNMYGKPSPNGSGNGWSGWYKDRFFKSLLELSFLINYVDRYNMNCKSAEKKEYRIKYKDYQEKERNYFPDYIINEKYMVEIKPEHLRNSFDVIRKKESAIIFCKENNLKYKMITPPRLSKSKIKNLIETEKVILIDRYKEKYEIWSQNQTIG